jgi:LmbE family N-acetylglucosaminyl deacetylase
MGIIDASSKTVAVIVAHPDDETLWAGGTILDHPDWHWFIISLCRGKDEDRSKRFHDALKVLNSDGIMGDLDDGPEQYPLEENEVENTILSLLPKKRFDLIISHSPSGEYTRHLRHEEAGRSVIRLWGSGKISASELWTFAYYDDNRKTYPKPLMNASIYSILSSEIWDQKYRLITGTYGFSKGGFEAETTPKSEAFWRFFRPEDAVGWLDNINNLKI